MSPNLSDEAVHELKQRVWYGNVRKLRNAMEHALIVARGGVIGIEHLPEAASASLIDTSSQDKPIDETISELIERWARVKLAGAEASDGLYEELLKLVEPSLLKAAIEKHHGQYSSAARS